MKIIIRYCLPWGNFSNKVINIEPDQDIKILQQQVERKFEIKPKRQILTYKRDGFTLKLLPGWPISHYGLIEKAIVFLESFENKDDDNDQEDSAFFKRDTVKKGGYFAKLGILNKIDEEDENDGEFNRKALKNMSPSIMDFGMLGSEPDYRNGDLLGGRSSLFRGPDQNSPLKGKEDVETLLRETKANNLENVLKILNKYPNGNINESEGPTPDELQKMKKDKIEHHGEQGWNALHWAVYLGHQAILTEFLSIKPNFNIQTSDGWTPLQLAVYRNQFETVKTLLKVKSLNINEVTKKSTALHIAVKNSKIPLVSLLLDHGADPMLKAGVETPMDVATNEKIQQLLQEAKERAILKTEEQKPTRPPIVKGWVYKRSEHLGKMNKRYLVMNADEGTLIYYASKEDYPNKPRQIIPLQTVTNTKQKEGRIFGKNLHYFQVYFQRKAMFGCNSEEIADKWIKYITQGTTFTKYIEESMKNELSKQTENKPAVFDGYFGETAEEIELEDPKSSKAKKSEKLILSDETVDPDESQISTVPGRDADELRETDEMLNLLVDDKVYFKSFEILKVLGAGAFGKVFKVRHKESNETYALKALRKKQLIVKRQLKYAIGEANVLKKAKNPFVLSLYFAFQTREYMYFVLDYCSGGDLSLHLIDKGKFTEDEARFFTAELILAIEYLHSIDILYRDLKPENILIGHDGHIKLADFGLSKEGVADKDIAKSFCGSPAYISPEMLKNKGVSKAADIYGIGTVLYELLVGESPYYTDDIPELYERINKGKLEIPKTLSNEAKNLLTKLLHKDPNQRIGVKNKTDLKNDPFFKGIDWEKLARKEIPPPPLNTLEEEDSDVVLDPKQIFNDVDYDENEVKANRIKNFTFVRTDHFN